LYRRHASSETDAAIFLAAAFTGLRRGELLALRWRDADFAGSTIRVRASYAAGQITTPKSEASRRLEANYRSPAVVAQRQAVLDALRLAPGERVLAIGFRPRHGRPAYGRGGGEGQRRSPTRRPTRSRCRSPTRASTSSSRTASST